MKTLQQNHVKTKCKSYNHNLCSHWKYKVCYILQKIYMHTYAKIQYVWHPIMTYRVELWTTFACTRILMIRRLRCLMTPQRERTKGPVSQQQGSKMLWNWRISHVHLIIPALITNSNWTMPACMAKTPECIRMLKECNYVNKQDRTTGQHTHTPQFAMLRHQVNHPARHLITTYVWVLHCASCQSRSYA